MSKRTKVEPDMSLYEGIRPEKLPREWFPFYVVYKYRWWKTTYIVSAETDVAAAELQAQMLKRGDLERCEIYGHYPRELLED